MKRFLLVLVALFIVMAMVAITLPARVVVPRLVGDKLPVQLEDISGSVWNGQAGRVLRNGKDLGRFEWQIQPMALLKGLFDAQLKLDGSELSTSAHVMARNAQEIEVQNLLATLPAGRLEGLLDVPALKLLGQVDVAIDHLTLVNRMPQRLQGKATWKNAGVSGAEQADFGTIVADFGSLASGGFGGTLSDQGGPLMVEGEFKTTLMGYEASALLNARDGNPQVLRALQYMGQPLEDGSVMFQVRGGLLGGK